MKKSILVYFMLCIALSGLGEDKYITRGHQIGEIYISSTWYWLGLENSYNAIFFSDDNGETLVIRYYVNIYSGEMSTGFINTDAALGVIYNRPVNELYISYDYGANWIFREYTLGSIYYSGCIEGEVYKRYDAIYLSNDYAMTFDSVSGPVNMIKMDIGSEPGEMYGLSFNSSWDSDSIYYCNNYSFDFVAISKVDSAIGGTAISGNYPKLSRGINPGEIFLVSWHLPAIFKIYYSDDFGHTFHKRYESSQCNFTAEHYDFTAGNEQGSFYYIKAIPWWDGYSTKLHIYYSSDTAKTFTEYIHILDTNFPVKINEDKYINKMINDVFVFPNPLTSRTTLTYNLKMRSLVRIQIFNSQGKQVEEIIHNQEQGKQEVNWNATRLPAGIYYYRIHTGTQVGSGKMILMNIHNND